jgi:signal transduction histidine kinase
MNEALEIKVRERTESLENTIQKLQEAQEALIISEKMAMFGRLSTGIAHELNSPLGAIYSSVSASTSSIPRLLDSIRILSDSYGKPLLEAVFDLAPLVIQKARNIRDLSHDRSRRKEIEKHIAKLFGTIQPEQAEALAEAASETGIGEAVIGLIERFGTEKTSKALDILIEVLTISRANAITLEGTSKASESIARLRELESDLREEDKRSCRTTASIDLSLSEALDSLHLFTRSDIILVREGETGLQVRGHNESLVKLWKIILTNALQAINYSGKIEIETVQNGTVARIRIKDNGPELTPQSGTGYLSLFIRQKRRERAQDLAFLSPSGSLNIRMEQFIITALQETPFSPSNSLSQQDLFNRR